MTTVTKIHMGQQYTDKSDGKEYIWMGSTAWAIMVDGSVVEVYQTKKAAQYYAERM